MPTGVSALPMLLLAFGGFLEPSVPTAAHAARCADDERLLRGLQLPTDGPALLEFLRWQHTAARPPAPLVKPRELLEVVGWQAGPKSPYQRVTHALPRLSSSNYRVREQALKDLIAVGPSALPPLAELDKTAGLELKRRLQRLRELMVRRQGPEAVSAALRLVRDRKPAGATAALLQYLPVADEHGEEEALATLWEIGMPEGETIDLMRVAITDPIPARRAAAALVLGRHGSARHQQVARQCLQDTDPGVRFRAAQGLLGGGDRAAVPVLLDMLAEAPLPWAERAEEVLLRLAGDSAPLALYPKFDKKMPPLPKQPNMNGIYSGPMSAVYTPNTPQPNQQPLEATFGNVRKQYHDGWVTWWQERSGRRSLPALTGVGPRTGSLPRAYAVAVEFVRCLNEHDAQAFRRLTDAPFALFTRQNQMNPYGGGYGKGVMQPVSFSWLTTRAQLDQYYPQLMASNQFGYPLTFKRFMPAAEFAKKAPQGWKSFLQTYRHSGLFVATADVRDQNILFGSVALVVSVRGDDVRVVAYQPFGFNGGY